MTKSFWAKLLLELELGRYFFLAVPRDIFLTAMGIKIFFPQAEWYVYTISFIVLIGILWISGWTMLRTGFYEKYQYHNPAFKKIMGEGVNKK